MRMLGAASGESLNQELPIEGQHLVGIMVLALVMVRSHLEARMFSNIA